MSITFPYYKGRISVTLTNIIGIVNTQIYVELSNYTWHPSICRDFAASQRDKGNTTVT